MLFASSGFFLKKLIISSHQPIAISQIMLVALELWQHFDRLMANGW